jgi:hypothetical protein
MCFSARSVARGLFGGLVVLTVAAGSEASPVTVYDFGVAGWRSDDTRNNSGVNLVGITNTNAPRPGQTPTGADDLAIEQQIQFVAGPAGATYGGGAVKIETGTSGSSKSNFSVVDAASGFADASDLVDPSFNVNYQFYKENLGNGSTLAFKLGIQSTDWGTGVGDSQETFVATRSGESAWDLVLVHVPTVSSSVWSTVNLTATTGDWVLFRQAGNAFFTPGPPANPFAQTLAAWNADPTWGPRLFGAGALVSSIQFGLGSGQANGSAYVDYLQTTLLNDNDIVNFGDTAPVPEPGTWVLLGSGLALIARARLRRRRQA